MRGYCWWEPQRKTPDFLRWTPLNIMATLLRALLLFGTLSILVHSFPPRFNFGRSLFTLVCIQTNKSWWLPLGGLSTPSRSAIYSRSEPISNAISIMSTRPTSGNTGYPVCPLNQASRWSLINLKKNNYSILAPTFIHLGAGRLVVKGGGPTATTTSPVGQVK